MTFQRLTIVIACSVFGLYVLLVTGLFGFTDPTRFLSILSSERVQFSIKLSVGAAALATLLSMTFGIPAGYALSRYDFTGKRLVDLILELPLVVTPVALGAMLLIFFNTRIGEMLQSLGVPVVFAFSGIVLSQFVATVGLTTRMIKTTFDEVPPRFEVVACTLGATSWQAFHTVTLPMARRGILAATILTFAKCIGEFGATIMLAGSMPMRTETLPISIFMRLGSADIDGMAVMILLLLTVGLSMLLVIKSILDVHHD